MREVPGSIPGSGLRYPFEDLTALCLGLHAKKVFLLFFLSRLEDAATEAAQVGATRVVSGAPPQGGHHNTCTYGVPYSSAPECLPPSIDR